MKDAATSRLLALAGAALAFPAFLINLIAHDGALPTDDLDRADGVFSFMFMAGAALVVAALVVARPPAFGRRGRWLLVPEAAMVALAAIWAIMLAIDPDLVDSYSNPLVALGDSSWPLHQLFMLVVGIAAMRGGQWPSPQKYALFGPVAAVVVVIASAALELDALAAVALSLSWTTVAAGIITLPLSDEAKTQTTSRGAAEAPGVA